MAKNNNRNGNQNGGNFGASAMTCNNCGKNGHLAQDCRSNKNNNTFHNNNNRNQNNNQNQNSNFNQNYNQDYSQNGSNGTGKWCLHCNKNNHNTDICKFKNQAQNGKQKGNKQNGNKWCIHCSKNNHNTENCSRNSQVGFNQNVSYQNGSNVHFQSGQFQNGQFQNAPQLNTQCHNGNNPNMRPCKYCSGSHYDSSCPTLLNNQHQQEHNPAYQEWNGNVPRIMNFQHPPVIQANPYASITCMHCTQPDHPSSRCPYDAHQQNVSFQSQFPENFAPIHIATPMFMQPGDRNPLINTADSNDGCFVRSYGRHTLPSGYSIILDDRFHPIVLALVDRDGDVVMGDTVFWTASVRERFEAYGDDSMTLE